MVKLGQKGGSTKKKLIIATSLMNVFYINVFLLCIKPAQEKMKVTCKKMCLKICLALNGVLLLQFFYFKNMGSKIIALLTYVPFWFNFDVV
jgi:hypothetical protein